MSTERALRRFENSSDEEDPDDMYFRTSTGVPFKLQVPATFENKQKTTTTTTTTTPRGAISSMSNNSSKISYGDDDDDIVDAIFGGTSSSTRKKKKKKSKRPISPTALIPSCANPETARNRRQQQQLQPIPKFRVLEPPQAYSFFSKQKQFDAPPDVTTTKLVPPLIVPRHHAQQQRLSNLLEQSQEQYQQEHFIHHQNSNINEAAVVQSSSSLSSSSPLVETYRALSSRVPSQNERLANKNRNASKNDLNLNNIININDSFEIETKRHPAFSSTKTPSRLSQLTFLEDKNVDQQKKNLSSLLGEIHHPTSRISGVASTSSLSARTPRSSSLLKISNNTPQQQQQQQAVVASTSSLSQASSTTTSARKSGGSNKNKNKKLLYHVPPPEDEYIEGDVYESKMSDDNNTNSASAYASLVEGFNTKAEIRFFDKFILPPILSKENEKKEATTGKRTSTTGLNHENSVMYDSQGRMLNPSASGNPEIAAAVEQLLEKKNTYSSFGSLVAPATTTGGEVATARVARTLFLAGLCNNLSITEKLKTKISIEELEQRLGSDFHHRRQVSKEDFVVFLSRILHEDMQHINRREVDLLFSLLDSNTNGIVDTRELRTELVKFIKTGVRDISFAFVANLLEGKESSSANAFISRFDIINIVNAIVKHYSNDKEVVEAVSSLPDQFRYNDHLARIPVAQFRDRILNDHKLLSIFQSVALEARRSRHANSEDSSTTKRKNSPVTTSINQEEEIGNFNKNILSNNQNSNTDGMAMSFSLGAGGRLSQAVQKVLGHFAPPSIALPQGGAGDFGSESLASNSATSAQQLQGEYCSYNNAIMGIRAKGVKSGGKSSGGATSNNTNTSSSGEGSEQPLIILSANYNNNNKSNNGRDNDSSDDDENLDRSNSRRINANQNNNNTNESDKKDDDEHHLEETSSSSHLHQLQQDNDKKHNTGRRRSIGGRRASFKGGDNKLQQQNNENQLQHHRNSSSSDGKTNHSPNSPTTTSSIRVSNPIVNADRFAVSDEEKQFEARENEDIQFYSKNNILYILGKDGQPRPVFQKK